MAKKPNPIIASVDKQADAKCFRTSEADSPAMALTGMLANDGFFTPKVDATSGLDKLQGPLAPRMGHFNGKAKNVIFLFMYGGPSHMDTFDYKPDLYPLDGKTIDVKTFGRGGKKEQRPRRRAKVEI